MAPRFVFTGDQLKRARDYATEEPSFTAHFMAWELGWPVRLCKALTAELLRLNVIEVIEPASRPFPAVYAFKVPRHRTDSPVAALRRSTDDDEPQADLATQRGVIVPHTRPRGPSGRPGRDRKRQERGVTVKRQRQGT